MTLSFRRAGALVAAVVATITLTPVASYAQTWTHDDAASDMVVVVDDTTGDTAPAPEQTNGDVTQTSAKLGYHWLRLRNTFTDLTVDDQNAVASFWQVNASSGRKYIAAGIADPTALSGEWELDHYYSDSKVGCPRMSHAINYTTHTMTTWIPARCLGYPRWVRIGAAGLVLNAVDDPDTGDTTLSEYLDDAVQDGAVTDELTLSPRVHRWS